MQPRNITNLVLKLEKAATYYREKGLLPTDQPTQEEERLTLEVMAKLQFFAVLIGILLGIIALTLIIPRLPTPEPELINPAYTQIISTPVLIEPTKQPQPEPGQTLIGQASYYSEVGCLGCSPNLTMANGERLDDTVKTLALTPETVRAHKLLNKHVTVTNLTTGDTTTAKVTDTGGFAKYNRVADLNVATKEAINCAGLCKVKIELDK